MMILAKEELATRIESCVQKGGDAALCKQEAELVMRGKERGIWLGAAALGGVLVGALGTWLFVRKR